MIKKVKIKKVWASVYQETKFIRNQVCDFCYQAKQIQEKKLHRTNEDTLIT